MPGNSAIRARRSRYIASTAPAAVASGAPEHHRQDVLLERSGRLRHDQAHLIAH
jgi:hypothetical protein